MLPKDLKIMEDIPAMLLQQLVAGKATMRNHSNVREMQNVLEVALSSLAEVALKSIQPLTVEVELNGR